MGKAQRMLMSPTVTGSNGFEAWRLLSVRFAPRTAGKMLNMLMTSLNPDLSGDLLDKLDVWETDLARFEAQTGEAVADSIRRAVLLSRTPDSVRDKILANIDSLDTYEKVREAIVACTVHRHVPS